MGSAVSPYKGIRPGYARSSVWEAEFMVADRLYFRRPQGIQRKERPLRSLAGWEASRVAFCDSHN